jgi:eukaryotic-like serine/threonine-protein kinase
VAVREGREAQRQRDQAEGLIEFMLGDLRKKLEPVGRLDVLDAVGDKALGYYSQQDLAGMDADSLGRRARALHLMGEIAEKRGKMAEAERRFKEAADSTAELLARDPKNTQRLFDHAQSSYWVGYAAWRQGKREVAQPRFEDYLHLAQTLTQLAPGREEWQVEVASAENNLGVLLLRSNEVQSSLARFEQARVKWQELLPTRPELSIDLAKTLGWLAEAQERLGLFEDSLSSQQSKLRALNTDRKNDRIVQDLEATTLAALGRLQLNLGRNEEAVRSAQAARDVYDSLARIAPDNLEMQAKLGFAQIQLAETAQLLEMPIMVRQALDALAPISARLLASDPQKPAWALRLRGRELTARMSMALAHKGDLSAERVRLNQFIADQSAATNLKAGLDPESCWVLALASLRLGDAWANESDRNAREQYVAVLHYLSSLIEESPAPRVKSLRAHALFRLGRTQEARSLAESLEASTYRHPEWQVDLSRRLASVQAQQQIQKSR